MMEMPKFILGHNALIGVHHTDRKKDQLKPNLSDSDIDFLRFVIDAGVSGVVLDNHPVAIEAANFLHAESKIEVFPMIPYAQAVVDKASSSGLSGVVREMASSTGPLVKSIVRSIRGLPKFSISQLGAHLAVTKYLSDYPAKSFGGVCFLHNVVTDLMLGWDSRSGIESFSKAIRMNGMTPGFVTLNPQLIPEIIECVGDDVWFMTSVNSAGIQMGPDRMMVEREIFSKTEINVLGMSLLGGGILEPREEIRRAFEFPAIKSVVIGTGSKKNLTSLLEIMSQLKV